MGCFPLSRYGLWEFKRLLRVFNFGESLSAHTHTHNIFICRRVNAVDVGCMFVIEGLVPVFKRYIIIFVLLCFAFCSGS